MIVIDSNISDARLKTDLQEITNSLDKVKQLTGYTYNRIDMETSPRMVGLIAQDVETVLPEAVSISNNNGYKSIAYGNLTALLVNAIKELSEQLEELKSRIGF